MKRGKGEREKNYYQCPMTADASSRGTRPTHCLPNAPCPMPHSQCPIPNYQCFYVT
ncbi:MAG: histidine kinase [Tolypothrix carrinoi HA7290-LM1]|nr:histidine kinase [Tolypothrix carrinoi HA7290-LM1]